VRLFISINSNDETRSALLSVQGTIKPQTKKGSFTRPENLHLTLAFLGETKEETIPLICSVIDNAIQKYTPPFHLVFSKVGYFKRFNKELWWIGINHTNPYLKTLKDIRQKITDGLSEKNIDFDTKQFKPHITLGREIEQDSPIAVPDQNINFPVRRISLMKSERINGILTYTEIFGVELG